MVGLQACVFALCARPSWPRNVRVLSACSAQTGRWTGWWVAWGQRAESHIPIRGLSAPGVPASRRQSAREGSVNQHYADTALCRIEHAKAGHARAFMLA